MPDFLKSYKNRISMHILRMGILVLVIGAAWCWTFNRTSLANWNTPIHYEGDGIWVAALVKSYSEGDIPLVGSKEIKRLNAPYGAVLDDWPVTEGCLFYCTGLLARYIGVFAAINVAFLMASVLAGISFYIACQQLKLNWRHSMAAATAFAFAPLLFYRLPGHIILAYYWMIPIGLVFLEKTLRGAGTAQSSPWRPIAFASLAGLLIGIQNVYYSWMFLQFCGLSIILLAYLKTPRKILPIATLACFIAIGFLLANAGTLIYRFQNGPNVNAVTRHLAELDIHGLRIPSLFVPPVNHRIQEFANWSMGHYYGRMTVGESSAPYLGIIGIIGFMVVVLRGVAFLLKKRKARAGLSLMELFWIFAYACCGGLNLFLGVFGLILFRGGNRFSIFILAISLFGLTRFLTRHCRKKYQIWAAICMMIIVLMDQLPRQLSANQIESLQTRVDSDQSLVSAVETRLENGAMVFQLPVCRAPEVPPFANMLPYEHYTPYVHSKTTKWSYGAIKGRGIESWQPQLEKLQPEEMIKQLESHGFSAIYISRRGYSDNAESLIASLKKAGLDDFIESKNKDLIVFFMTPRAQHQEPPLGLSLASKFWGWEKNEAHTWSWARNNARLGIFNPTTTSRTATLSFGLNGRGKGVVEISYNGKKESYQVVSESLTPVSIELTIAPGSNSILISSNIPEKMPGGNDTRKMAFGIFDLRITPEHAVVKDP